MYGIIYDHNKKRVKQKLNTISTSDFEGSFDYILKKVQEHKEWYIETYGTEPKLVRVYDSYYKYADGEKEKMVVFDKFEVEMETEYDEKVYVVYGERNFLPEEIAAFQKQKDEDAEKKKKEELKLLETLKNKYENS
jgi:hypothetical protein